MSTYLRCMKKKRKLTLTVNDRSIALLRKAGARRAKSISAMLEELAEQLAKEDSADTWSSRNEGILAGRITAKRMNADDRLGHLLRKHLGRARTH